MASEEAEAPHAPGSVNGLAQTGDAGTAAAPEVPEPDGVPPATADLGMGPASSAAAAAASDPAVATAPAAPASAGRWRLEVIVPRADVQDILPAAQLLSTSLVGGPRGGGGGSGSGRDYNTAKAGFLSALGGSGGIALEDLRLQVSREGGGERGQGGGERGEGRQRRNRTGGPAAAGGVGWGGGGGEGGPCAGGPAAAGVEKGGGERGGGRGQGGRCGDQIICSGQPVTSEPTTGPAF